MTRKNLYKALIAVPVVMGMQSCINLKAGESDGQEAFEYRSIYLPNFDDDENEELKLSSLDDTWGLWGHNLSSVLPDNASKQVYAKVNGAINADQFCFSSEKLYDYIVDYVNANYIFEDSVKFAILPNDNGLVCLCSECVRAGNTKGNTSPTVFNLIEKLANKFPEHQFFTSYYHTTQELPDRPMPTNAGVWVSSMHYPFSAAETHQEREFIYLLQRWGRVTDKVYVWDYINNFDDYFTPIPLFTIMQRRFKHYRDAGVNGVFLNGSGNDYSTFWRLKKAVLAHMLQNPDIDWEETLRKYAAKYYPVAGNDIADFIVAQERMVAEKGKRLPYYGGVETAIRTYLPEQEFVEFYNKIVQHKKVATGQEKEDLENMTDAMALTMLEIKRINNNLEDTGKLKERLARLPKKDINFYNEGCWSIDRYLKNYEFMEQDAMETASTNLLKDVKLKEITPLDEDYPDIRIVTDGQLGIPSNYHNGNLISSADPELKIGIPRVPGMSRLKVWMVYNPGFKIGLPDEVSIKVDGVKRGTQVPEKPQGGTGHSFVEFDIPPHGDIVLSLRKNPEIKTMAIDEIQAF